MKHTCKSYLWKSIFSVVVTILLNNVVVAQTDTTKAVAADTAAAVAAAPVAAAPVAAESSSTSDKKKRHFVLYAGVNSNSMGGSTEKYNSNSGVGYHIGVSWKTKGFFFGQFGLRFNNAVYGFQSKATSKDTGDLKVQALDLPLTAGINIISIGKLASIRGFGSLMPSFRLGVSDNHFGIDKDDVNSFILYGQLGLGADVVFGMIEVGYNYGFSDLMENSDNTNPGQWFLSLGINF